MAESQPFPIHIGLNAHLLSGEGTYRSAGVHQYIRHLLLHLPGTGCRLTALMGPHSPRIGEGYAVERARWPTERPPVRIAWEQLVQPAVLRQIGVDLAHGPVFVGPLMAPCPFVVTLHDLSFIRFPHLFHPAKRLYLRTMTRASVHRARRVIAVSRHAAEEAHELLEVDPAQVDVVYHGVDPRFHPRPAAEVAAFRADQGLPERFVLFLGTLEPRKNLVRLIEAFDELDVPDVALVLAGGRGWYEEEIFACVERLELKERVIFPGYVPGAALPLWYNAATVFAYPSLYEGFGMPVTEAQASGVPTLTSDRSSLPEAAGDAALLVDPFDVDAIADGLRQLLTNGALREELRQRGLVHTREFTWQRMAAQTRDVYRRALEGEAV